MKPFKLLALALFTTTLAACGGSSSDSSYSGTFSTGGVTYQCNTESAFDACSKDRNCSGCSSNQPQTQTPENSAVITATCASTTNGYSVSTTGCVIPGTQAQTAICSGNRLQLLTGTGITVNQLLDKGSSFSSNGLNINGTAISCAA